MKAVALILSLLAGRQDEMLPEVPPADAKALEKIREIGAAAVPVAAKSNLLIVNLGVAGARVTDAQVELLKPVAEQILELNLAGTAVTDAALARLAAAKNLRTLRLERTAVGDAGLAHLAGLAELRTLNLHTSKVTDKGLVHLKGLKKLRHLFLWQTAATQSGVADLGKALPAATIVLNLEPLPASVPAPEKIVVAPVIVKVLPSGLDDEGFIRTWLLLAPIPLKDPNTGAQEIARDTVSGEANLRPKAGMKTEELTWKEHKAPEYYVDFKEVVGEERGTQAAGYAACYVHAESDMGDLKLKISTNDQGKVYLNGKEVFEFTETRSLDKDQDTVEVALRKGENVIVFKVVNEQGGWQGCMRFTDSSGAPIKNIKVVLTPQ